MGLVRSTAELIKQLLRDVRKQETYVAPLFLIRGDNIIGSLRKSHKGLHIEIDGWNVGAFQYDTEKGYQVLLGVKTNLVRNGKRIGAGWTEREEVGNRCAIEAGDMLVYRQTAKEPKSINYSPIRVGSPEDAARIYK